MQGPEFIVAIVGILSGAGLTVYIFMNIFKLIRTWIGGNSEVDEESFNQLAKAFMEHKKEMQQRMEKVEARLSDGEDYEQSDFAQIEEPSNEGSLSNDLQNSNEKIRS